jgi:hypothetical protein
VDAAAVPGPCRLASPWSAPTKWRPATTATAAVVTTSALHRNLRRPRPPLLGEGEGEDEDVGAGAGAVAIMVGTGAVGAGAVTADTVPGACASRSAANHSGARSAGVGRGVASVAWLGTNSVGAPDTTARSTRWTSSAEGRSSGSLASSAWMSGSSGPACFIGASGSTAMAYAVSTAVSLRNGGRPSTDW